MDVAELKARAQRRKLIIQGLIIAVTALAVYGAIQSAKVNLSALGLTSGFGFLERSTGWSYSFSLIDRDISDSYARTLTIGFLNTLFVGALTIVLSTIIGFLIGTFRDSRNPALKTAATVYTQIFRNIPLILQGIFWYAIMIHLPGPRQAMSLSDGVFLSNRGLMVPVLNLPLVVALVLVLIMIAAVFLLRKARIGIFQSAIAWVGLLVLLLLVASGLYVPTGESVFSWPELKGLRFVGGLTISPELLVMIIAIVLYGSAYIAEVVRGGLAEVPKGLIEAGEALGLNQRAIWSRIKMPMALRTIIPPLGNQWIFIMKATTIGVAIGFSDLFYIVSTSITQSGQTLELIAILMGCFLLVNFSIAQFVNWLNDKLKLKAH
ncbi:ABC transporter permease subunit [Ruegeria sp. 2205SS24-7]|uniref:ABC transporter permease subunit n=1 Tax=Ruegeria discodermiae TaxID=3064389 RepID=UPI00274163F1|nr:ABC transporter permease subunit [Ruegeria sp. 2205SS24-7]MDP5217288.1 ABC transporter permease subunit [Ruegeria sp. 2205SS24-7]